MRLLRHFFLRLVPLALIAGVVYVLFSSSTPLQSDRIGAINLTSGPSSAYASGGFDSWAAAEQSAGIAYVRETLDWSQIEPSAGTYNWSSPLPYAAIFSSEKAQGFKVIAVLSGGPEYLSATQNGLVDTTQFLLRWANFVQSAVDNLGENVDVWEIGSQLNTSTGMSPFLTPSSPTTSTTPDPKLYAQMLIVANKIIKSASPSAEIWMGSLVSAESSQCILNPLTFLLEVNGAKGWDEVDSIEYTPDRGAIAPETAGKIVNSACSSSLPLATGSLSGDVQTLQALVNELGGKPLRIEGLNWSSDELATLSTNRSISSGQVLADYLTRATIQLAGSNGLTDFSWQADPSSTSSALTALTNLNSVLTGAQFQSQPQGASGSVFEYRFTKGSQWIIIAWHAQDGDNPVPVTLSNLPVDALTAYAVDAANFTSGGTSIPVSSGSATILLNERPVVFLGRTADLGTAMQQDAADQVSQWQFDLKQAVRKGEAQLKAAMLQALENAFDSAKDKAVQWGEDKLNSLLN